MDKKKKVAEFPKVLEAALGDPSEWIVTLKDRTKVRTRGVNRKRPGVVTLYPDDPREFDSRYHVYDARGRFNRRDLDVPYEDVVDAKRVSPKKQS